MPTRSERPREITYQLMGPSARGTMSVSLSPEEAMSIFAKIWKRPDVVRAVLALVVAIIVAVLENRLVG